MERRHDELECQHVGREHDRSCDDNGCTGIGCAGILWQWLRLLKTSSLADMRRTPQGAIVARSGAPAASCLCALALLALAGCGSVEGRSRGSSVLARAAGASLPLDLQQAG